jgi:hypothetical protein
VKELILAPVVDLRILARIAPLCQDFHKAHLTRTEEGRASLIALAEETYGKSLCHTFTTALGRALCGLDPCSSLMGDDWKGFDDKCIFITHAGEARHRDVCECLQMPMKEPCGIILEPYPGEADMVFKASLNRNNRKWNGVIADMVSMACYIRRDHAGKVSASIDVQYVEAAPEALGLLLYLCGENPEAFIASSQSPLTVRVHVWAWGIGAHGVREAEDLFATLRPLVDSVKIERYFSSVVINIASRNVKFPY